MAKKILIVFVVVLVGAIYYYLYRDSFVRAKIPVQVMFRERVGPRMRASGGQNPEMLIFGLSKEYKLTSVQVISVDALATNKSPHPLWHMVSDSNSFPVVDFAYGGRIRGMHPEFKGADAEPLAPNTSYRILIKAGSTTGEKDFKTPADLPQQGQ
jgi:hypothetical protein